ncbi:type II toxin-antitoxin system RelE/ParE family toxin [Desulfonatronum thiodismutans]|uniref:type II toxin-antitoxin system RelE/ParE family toxin n=1 Tax=Desulfonatronum thiodismutans TaxID=159290 RepID=UPI0004ABE314|nr:type II toxin-antitoxin system RelE/ParE family toxin [Desulfonatronum thiodismutans]
MPWSVIFCEEFVKDFEAMPEGLRESIAAHTKFLRELGPVVGRPLVDTLKGSTFPNMKELRFDWESGVWRIAFAFDPQRKAVLLVGADKRGVNQKRFYKDLIQVADQRYQKHLVKLEGDHVKDP